MPPNSELEVSNGDVHVLHYNVNWMDSVFRSRAAAEALLSPERESGNLTSRDYDAAIQFLPGTHHYYPMVGLAAGIAVGFGLRLRYPRMSGLKQLSLFSGTTFTGHFVGMFRKISAHLDYLHDIEYPDGYRRAMENIQKNLPVQRRNIVLERNYQISQDDPSPQPTSEHADIPSESSPSLDSSLTERSQNKWDQIRAANIRTARGSTWDALRQQHEKVRVKPNPQGRNDDRWTSDG